MPDQQAADNRPDAADKAADVRGDEFFEYATQGMAANFKHILDGYVHADFADIRRGRALADKLDGAFAQLVQDGVTNLGLATKNAITQHNLVNNNNATLAQLQQLVWLYNLGYDLANPTAIGMGQNLGAGALNPQRITDTTGAIGGGALSVGAGVATAAVLQQLVTSVGQMQQTLSALAAVLVTSAGGASTPSQTKPPTPAPTPAPGVA